MSMENNVLKIDAIGKQCPIPMVLAKQAIKEWNGADGILQILVDNEIAVQNLTKMAKQLQQEVTVETHSDHVFQVSFIIKNKNSNISFSQQEQIDRVENQTKGEDVFIAVVSSETMGDGDKELGKILIKGFFYALTQMEKLPKSILFYNGGAKLTCESSECLKDILYLQENGVEILTCGTCLDFYHLKEHLKVGTITNMYEIVEKQALASKIIRP